MANAAQVNSCPETAICKDDLVSFDLGNLPGYTSAVSDTASCLGSVAIVLIYLAWKDLRRKGAQSIVTYLAIADFCTALAYLVDVVNVFAFSSASCKTYNDLCKITSYIVTWSIMSSFFWTLILAFYFHLATFHCRPMLAMKLMPVYHIIAWGLPILVSLPLLCVDRLEYAPYVSAVWCYINTHSQTLSGQSKTIHILVKLPEIIGYVIILVFFVTTSVSLRRQAKQLNVSQAPMHSPVHTRVLVNKILVLIPILFIILRIWSTFQHFYFLYLTDNAVDGCISRGEKTVYVALGFLQGIGDGGQGWVNTILYVFLSREMRKRLFWMPALRLRERYFAWKEKREYVRRNNRALHDESDWITVPSKTTHADIYKTSYQSDTYFNPVSSDMHS